MDTIESTISHALDQSGLRLCDRFIEEDVLDESDRDDDDAGAQTNRSVEYPRVTLFHTGRKPTGEEKRSGGVAPRDNVLQFMHVGRAARGRCTIE